MRLTFDVPRSSGRPGSPPAAAPTSPPPEVLFVEVIARDVAVTFEWLGTTEGSVDADIRTQVAGYLVSRDFCEGSRAEIGTLLFRIDPRPFQAARARPAARRAGRSLKIVPPVRS